MINLVTLTSNSLTSKYVVVSYFLSYLHYNKDKKCAHHSLDCSETNISADFNIISNLHINKPFFKFSGSNLQKQKCLSQKIGQVDSWVLLQVELSLHCFWFKLFIVCHGHFHIKQIIALQLCRVTNHSFRLFSCNTNTKYLWNKKKWRTVHLPVNHSAKLHIYVKKETRTIELIIKTSGKYCARKEIRRKMFHPKEDVFNKIFLYT